MILLSVIPLSGAYCIKRQRMRDMIDRDRKKERVRKIEREREKKDRYRAREIVRKIERARARA